MSTEQHTVTAEHLLALPGARLEVVLTSPRAEAEVTISRALSDATSRFLTAYVKAFKNPHAWTLELQEFRDLTGDYESSSLELIETARHILGQQVREDD